MKTKPPDRRGQPHGEGKAGSWPRTASYCSMAIGRQNGETNGQNGDIRRQSATEIWASEDELAATLPKLAMRAFLCRNGKRDSAVTTYDDNRLGNYPHNTCTTTDGSGVRGQESLRNHDKKRQMKKTLDSRHFLAEPFKSARCAPSIPAPCRLQTICCRKPVETP